VLIEYPNGTWLENMAEDPGGRLFFSVTSDKTIEVFEPGRGVRHFADLPIHPMGIAILHDRLVVAGNRRPLSDGVAALNSNAIAEVSLDGRTVRLTDVPEARMLNGVVLAPNGAVLVADSRASTIWTYDSASGAAMPWLRDERLGPPAAAPPTTVGANGLKLLGTRLLISNTGCGEVQQARLSPRGDPVGGIETFRKTGVIDDFDVTTDGTIYAAPYGTTIVRVSQDATDVVLADGAEGATAVLLIGGRLRPSAFYVTTTGNVLIGGRGPARLLRVQIPNHPA
jgi:sugar lactone lactonase YvrE